MSFNIIVLLTTLTHANAGYLGASPALTYSSGLGIGGYSSGLGIGAYSAGYGLGAYPAGLATPLAAAPLTAVHAAPVITKIIPAATSYAYTNKISSSGIAVATLLLL